MIQINIHVKVKFRAFFMDLFKFERTVAWKIDIPTNLPIPIPPSLVTTPRHTLINDRGVFLEVWAGENLEATG